MRLDKFLASQGLGSRSEVRALLHAGRVCVDGKPVRDAGLAINPAIASISLDGEPLAYTQALHIMMYKPTDVITAARDPRHATVMDLLPPLFAARHCMPIGRLDRDAEGLLLFTTDGQLSHRLLSPKRHVDKLYRVRLDGPVTPEDIEAFEAGLALSDFVAKPAALRPLPDNEAEVTIQEGKFHQVKRMFHARGREVLRLKRIAFGGITLDPVLTPGQYRDLTESELSTLRTAAGGDDNA